MRFLKKNTPKSIMPIAPMIDCVFLMLIYFMVSASLKPQEADIAFELPGIVEQTDPLQIPDEQIIEITTQGQVFVNDYPYDTADSERFVELTNMLARYKQTSEANKVEASVSIAPNDTVIHQTIIKVMDACSAAGINNVNFSITEEEF
jgi:biopolymer transport protein ExbD